MLKINKGEPWIMWPNSMVTNFIEYPANRIFDYEGNFIFTIIFKLNEIVIQKSTLFARLPTYFGIDLEENGITFILTDKYKETKYRYSNFDWEIDFEYRLDIKKIDDIIGVYINNLLIFQEIIKLGGDENSHIIFGAGNFPKNGFNLNYFSFSLIFLEIKKDDETICSHDFQKFIENKSYDLSGNCNFINKI